ncbi:hypothetical protein SSP24_13130 [Streptomyces spinoverrucosus]|uniref:Uncharacterized protein n=1 Tax=Streptomyces spinoverrucosus TaxID=284043 RepID=A0A4Y3VC49_9ACTN|nr:hypothetical protein SSP24_13130 [Streptomyces spinoverrucosus]GHB51005.1 hypothetical protein GCM10010397_21540 [Streptomyces spinoverrucosus]
MCSHQPSCSRPDARAPHVVAAHPEQGWTLLCSGAIVFDDTGELLPDGRVVSPWRQGSTANPSSSTIAASSHSRTTSTTAIAG